MAIVPFSPAGSEDSATEGVTAKAIEWRMCLAEGRATEQACRAWRDADPAHDAAWREVESVWAAVADSEPELASDWRAELDDIRREGRGRTQRFAGMAIAASLALVAGLSWFSAQPNARYATQTGETSEIALDDGSTVTLGGKSAMDLHFASSERRIVLGEGEAFFEVSKDADRPFVVEAGDSLVRVTGTKFDVRSDDSGVTVSVLEGRVEVGDQPGWFFGNEPKDKRVLTAGLTSSRATGEARFAAPQENGVAAGSWRSGRFFYQDAPLAQIVSDLSRYSNTPIRIGDSAAGRLRLTTSFEVDAIPEFLATLAKTLPVEESRSADGGTIIQSRRPVQ